MRRSLLASLSHKGMHAPRTSTSHETKEQPLVPTMGRAAPASARPSLDGLAAPEAASEQVSTSQGVGLATARSGIRLAKTASSLGVVAEGAAAGDEPGPVRNLDVPTASGPATAMSEASRALGMRRKSSVQFNVAQHSAPPPPPLDKKSSLRRSILTILPGIASDPSTPRVLTAREKLEE